MKKKIYGFNNGGSPGWYSPVAIGEDGAFLTSHICSSEAFMYHDLGISSNWKHEIYDKHFGEGNWEIEWVPSNELDAHKGLTKALELNKTVGESAAAERAGVEVTMVDDKGVETTHSVTQ